MEKRQKYLKQLCPAVICTFITLFIYVLDGNKELRIFDAADYWYRGEAIYSDAGGVFLYNLPDAFRGYIFPLYLGTIGKFLGGINGYKIINSIMVGVFFGHVFPKLFPSNVQLRTLKTIICFGAFIILARGVIIYPLSDTFALSLCVCAIFVGNSCSQDNPLWKNILFAFFCGAMCYLAYNVRTIYLFAGMFVLLRLWFDAIRNPSHTHLSKLQIIVSSSMGWGIAGIPQCLLNRHFHGDFSLFVPTSDLMRAQLFWGLQYQRYDTFAGIIEGKHLIEHPAPQMYFIDSVGTALIAKEGLTGFATWGDFIKFVFKYPVEIGGIYVKHFINALLPCWPSQYVYDMDNNKIFLATFLLVISFLFLVAIYGKILINNSMYINFIPLLIPVLFILPGAVETRFFIAIYIMIIYTLGFNTDWKKMYLHICENIWKTITLFVLYSGVICSIWSNLLVSESVYKIFMY